jgi:hypothetical protein
VVQAQFGRMKEISVEFAVFLRKGPVVALTVDVVANDGVSDSAQMDSDLVRTPRLDFDLKERETLEIFNDPVIGLGRSAAGGLWCHPGPDPTVPADGEIDPTGGMPRSSVDQCQIRLLNTAFLERFP